MIINFSNNHKLTTNLMLKGEQIDVVNKIKILGVTVNNQLNWNEKIAILVKNSITGCNFLGHYQREE